MTTVPVLEEIVPQEQLDAWKQDIAANTVQLLDANLIPLLRKATGYTGDVHATASVQLKFTEVDGQFTLGNNVSVGIEFPPLPPYDIMEQVQRTIFTEMFVQAVKRYL